MKHKVGDKVRVKSKEWYEKHKDEYSGLVYCGATFFVKEMRKFLGVNLTIKEERRDSYLCEEDSLAYFWTDEMFEGESEEEKPTKRNLEDNLWICDVAKERACEYFRVSTERMEELKNEWEERLQSGDYAIQE